MRKDLLGLMLMWTGAGTLLGAVGSAVGSRALGNPIERGFLLVLMGAGVGGTAALAMGIVLLVQGIREPEPVPKAPSPQPGLGDSTSWSAIAFLVLLVLLATLYLGLVFVTSGITGVLLQFVFFVPIGVVILLLGRWWSRMQGSSSGRPGLPK